MRGESFIRPAPFFIGANSQIMPSSHKRLFCPIAGFAGLDIHKVCLRPANHRAMSKFLASASLFLIFELAWVFPCCKDTLDLGDSL